MNHHATLEREQLPLHGKRVIEFGQYIAAPAAGQTLADLGADVIKIEPPGGDTARRLGWEKDDFGPMFSAYNRGKRSVVLDLRQKQDLQQALTLIAQSDVLLQNARPGTMEKFALDSVTVRKTFPALIYGQVSAFGQNGEYSQRPGFDIAAQAESGMMSLNGFADRDPVRIGFTVVDLLASQALVTGVLAALLRRYEHAKGALVDVSLIDVAVSALANAWAEYGLNQRMPLRRGNGQATVAPAAEVLQAQDGLIVLSAYTDAHFSVLCRTIERMDLLQDNRFANNQARVANRSELNATLSDSFGSMSVDALAALLNKAGLVFGVIRTMDQVKAGQGGVSNDLFVSITSSQGTNLSLPGLPFSLDGQARNAAHLPALGEHTDEVLAQLAKG
ncbi:CaiB/BaiF CoA transferase family protein [Alcaligenes endophyticus]|uniref:CoA transferase n=1 Tax=Alcaligenes endophyticus TaxID=1929088 RepID=A0ABT8EJH4_9BURK|nr:CoA transferase [Alcaligenes endophyticus]MCX5591751.1 CoA transferase [Alcaligenes endophyticus]MDN4121428.1 CoA transferase [Alcaligenes endophyticus]